MIPNITIFWKSIFFFQKIMSVSYGVCPNFEGEISQRCIKSNLFVEMFYSQVQLHQKSYCPLHFQDVTQNHAVYLYPYFIYLLFIYLFSYLFFYLFIYWEISHTFRCLRTCRKILQTIMTFRQWCHLRLVTI